MKKRTLALAAATLAIAAGCAGSGPGWTTLVDNGKGLENFDQFRQANWQVKDEAIFADSGGKDPAYLVSKKTYKDFEMRVEFWASHDANSGVFLRCQNRSDVGDETCYEANIFDQRPDQTHATGAIVKVAAVAQPAPKVGGKWSVYEITANGPQLTVVLNGMKTVDVRDTKFASGPIALQWGRGTIKFRKVEIKPV